MAEGGERRKKADDQGCRPPGPAERFARASRTTAGFIKHSQLNNPRPADKGGGKDLSPPHASRKLD
jgi:hypothetical protein